MFSSDELNMLNAVLNAYNKDNVFSPGVYYVAFTSDSSDLDYPPDLTIAVSTSKILTDNGYDFYIEDGKYTLYTCYSSNYGAGRNRSKIDSISVTGSNLSVDKTEFISSNAESLLVCTYDFSNKEFLQNEKIIQTNIGLCLIFCSVLIFSLFSRFFDKLLRFH